MAVRVQKGLRASARRMARSLIIFLNHPLFQNLREQTRDTSVVSCSLQPSPESNIFLQGHCHVAKLCFHLGQCNTKPVLHEVRVYLMSFTGSNDPYSCPLPSTARAMIELKASRTSGYFATTALITAILSWKATPEFPASGF